MGVSGSGKSSIAKSLAYSLQFTFIEADDYHSSAAKQQMANNQPLNDDMRKPWVAAIVNKLELLYKNKKSVVLAFSGLKEQHRNLLRETPFVCHFLYLTGERDLLKARLLARKNHFFSPELLDSQFEAMESPLSTEKDVSLVDVNNDLETILRQVKYIALNEFNKEVL